MLIRLRRSAIVTLGLLGLASASCLPTRDLDATALGPASASAPTPTVNEAGASGTSMAIGGAARAGGVCGGSVSVNDGRSGGGPAGSGGTTSAASGGGVGGSEPTLGIDGAGTSASGDGSGGVASAEEVPLADLPNELKGSPVQGVLTFAESTVRGQKFFQIVSPLAGFTLSATTGNITQLDDRSGGNVVQWMSPGGSARHVGIITTPQPRMTTVLDQDSYTARHVRLRCTSDAGWAWTWDFYPSQATISLTQAAGTYGFAFSGTPGDQLESSDEMVPNSGKPQSALSSFLEDLPGPTEWAYLTDGAYKHSLFLIQHDDDELDDRYDAIGGDTATWLFGNGHATRAQRRYSIGFLSSTEQAKVAGRIQYVIGALP